MSNWPSAVLAANKAVIDPNILKSLRDHWERESRGKQRIIKNTPATTIVELWSRAETGVGPSIAEGNQGCKINWADLPVAATIIPRSAQQGKGWKRLE